MKVIATIILLWSMSAVSAIFFPFQQFATKPKEPTLTNICVYSSDPAKFKPKCFLCPNSAYQNILKACVDVASIPSNVSFTQASCIEQNCAINYPQGNTGSATVRVRRDTPNEPAENHVVSLSGRNEINDSGSASEKIVDIATSWNSAVNETVRIGGRSYRISRHDVMLASDDGEF